MKTGNECQFDGSARGHYEVWFLTLNDPVSGCGFWLRYTLDAAIGQIAPTPGVWASVFDASRPNGTFGLCQELPTTAWKRPEAGTGEIFAAGAGALGHGFARGTVSDGIRRISWDLTYETAGTRFDHIDPFARRLLRPKTVLCAPNLAVRFDGTVTVDGRVYTLEGAPGCQEHIWGKRHAESWAWAHCNVFDGGADAVFEGLSARPRLGPVTLPWLTMLYLRHDGEDFLFNDVRRLFTARSEVKGRSWRFAATDGLTRLSGEAAGNDDWLQAVYGDPDGGRSYCVNSEIARLSLTVERRLTRRRAFAPAFRLTATRTAHFEVGSRVRAENVAEIALTHARPPSGWPTPLPNPSRSF